MNFELCKKEKSSETFLQSLRFSGVSSFNSNVKTESNDEMMIAVDKMIC